MLQKFETILGPQREELCYVTLYTVYFQHKQMFIQKFFLFPNELEFVLVARTGNTNQLRKLYLNFLLALQLLHSALNRKTLVTKLRIILILLGVVNSKLLESTANICYRNYYGILFKLNQQTHKRVCT
jgi:hypothetical protein